MFGNGKIFVSHAHTDNAACEPVLTALDAWQVDYWFDRAQLSAGLEFADYIQRGLEERDIFLRICTPAALASRWMDKEQNLARALRAPNRSQRRRMINLILQPGYALRPGEESEVVIDATTEPQADWLQRLRVALDVPSRERRMSRRAALGLGVTSLAALGAMGFAGNLFLNRSSADLYRPTAHEPAPTPFPGATRVRWTYGLASLPLSTAQGASDAVTLEGGTLICVCLSEGSVTALSSADGSRHWTQTYSDLSADAPPAVVRDTIYLTSGGVRADPAKSNSFLDDTSLVALRTSDGSERWRRTLVTDKNPSLDFQRINSGIAAAGSMIWVRSNETLYTFDAATGKPLWRQSAGKPPSFGEVLPTPIVLGGVVYAVMGDGKLHAFSARDGSPVWRAPFSAGAPIRSQPVVAGGVIYVGADGGYCFALDAQTTRIRWKAPLLKTSHPEFTVSGLTLSGGALYVSGGFPNSDIAFPAPSLTGGTVQALDAATGKIHWASVPAEQLKLSGLQDDYIRTRPLVVGSRVFVATRLAAKDARNVNMLYALDRTTGKVRWDFEMWGGKVVGESGSFPSAPVASHGVLYIASGDDTLYALDISH